MSAQTFDYIIVGGGLAGLVIASRLSEDAGISVLVVESGQDQVSDDRVTVPGMWPALMNTSSAYRWKTVPQAGMDNRQVDVLQGCMLGGSTGINGLQFSVTSQSNVDAWEALGNPGWGWSAFRESMEKAYTPAGSKQQQGPLKLSVPEDSSDWSEAWHDTLSNLGYRTDNNAYSGNIHGGFVLPDTVDPETNTRSYARSAYYHERPNLTVWTSAKVEKVIFDEAGPQLRAIGVQLIRNETTEIASAGKEVILTAGVLHSPQILEASGVGHTNRLQGLGIKPLLNLPGVGENLQNHVMSTLCFQAKDEPGFETLDPLTRQEPDALAAAGAAYAQGKGPLSMSNANHAAQLPLSDDLLAKADVAKIIGSGRLLEGEDLASKAFAEQHEAFVQSVLESETEASAQYMSFAGYAAYNPDGSFASPPSSGRYLTLVAMLSHPLSRGSVHLTRAAGKMITRIDPRYLSHPADVDLMARHVQQLEKIASTEPLASHLILDQQRNQGTHAVNNLSELEAAKDFIRKYATPASHYTGTCSMMPEELGGVVDAQLRVYGCRNLRVCDASIIPLLPRANPQASVYGVAEHAARIIRSSA